MTKIVGHPSINNIKGRTIPLRARVNLHNEGAVRQYPPTIIERLHAQRRLHLKPLNAEYTLSRPKVFLLGEFSESSCCEVNIGLKTQASWTYHESGKELLRILKSY